MNEHNHHKIIERFSRTNGLSKKEQRVLEKASDFTDSINAEWKYFFYHFYYSIEVLDNSGLNQGTIRLYRVDENTNVSAQDMNRCGEIDMSLIGSYQKALQFTNVDKFNGIMSANEGIVNANMFNTTLPYSSRTNEKEFFSTINERKKSPKSKLFDIGNQSDNVAFLHAMSSVEEGEGAAKEIFKEHLKRCFSEYLFLENEKKALFMLGIAMHGIMDSFTPSHTLFQNYEMQDMAKHAQGDVIPFPEDVLYFIPGQFNKEGFGAQLLDVHKKGFDGNDILSPIELKMLHIYIMICDIKTGEIGEPWREAYYYSRHEINMQLKKLKYGPNAFIYLNNALFTMCEVYETLRKFRGELKMHQNDNPYTCYKKSSGVIDNACAQWEYSYDEFVKAFDEQLLKLCFKKSVCSVSRIYNIDGHDQ